MRRGPGTLYRRWQSLRFLVGRDRAAVVRFLRAPLAASLRERVELVARFLQTTNAIRAYHTQAEMVAVTERILRLAGRPGLTVVEAGAAKGGATVKLSLAARLAGGELHVFDSFRGMPPNDDVDHRWDGRPVTFREGAFRGRLSEVRRNVQRLGAIDRCTFHKGWLADTLPAFDRPVDVAFVDVDLVSSVRTSLVHLVPRLRPGGVLFSQDGHLQAVVQLIGDPAFWRDEVGVAPPRVEGLGQRKLLAIEAPAEEACERAS